MAKTNYEIDSVRLRPLDFVGEDGYVGEVEVDTVGAPFNGTVEIFEGELFAVTGNVVSSAPLPVGSYSLTLLVRDQGQAYYSMQTVTAHGVARPPDVVDPPEPEPSTDNTMTLTNLSGTAVVDYPLQFARAFVEGEISNYAEIVLDGLAVPTQCDVKNRWSDGSVKFAIMAAVVPSLLPGVSTTVQFVNGVSNNTPSDLSSVPAYDARIVLHNPVDGMAVHASAREMLDAGKYLLWTSGPIAQTYIFCDRTSARVYDIGWTGHRAFHPWFIVTVWPGLEKVHTRFVGEICNSEAMEAQNYNLDLTVAGAGVYSQHNIAHLPGSRWSRTAWYGGVPEPKVNLYHNVAYLAQTKLVPKYDPAVVIPASTSETKYTNWLVTNRSIGGAGQWQPSMPTTGGRLDIGLNPSWNVSALLSGDWRDREIALGQAELAGWWKRHIREGDPAKANFGRTIHCHTRGTYGFLDSRFPGNAADAVTVIDAGAANGWQSDIAHHPDPFSIPYLLTGDPFFLDGLEMWQGCNSLWGNPGYRNYNHMTCYGDGQPRAMGWMYRTLFSAAALLPDADPLKAVFALMVDEAIAKDEGQRHINSTEFAGSAQHTFGAAPIGTTGDGWAGYGPGPCRWWAGAGGYSATDPVYYNTAVAYSASGHWMNFFVIASLGRGRELGYPVDALLQWAAYHVIGQFGTPGYPPQLVGQYVVPDLKKVGPGAAWFTSWEEVLTGWSAQKQTGRLNGEIEITYWGLPINYYNEGRTALSFVVDQPGGEEAWIRCEETIAAKTLESGVAIPWYDDPTWAVVP